MLKLTFQTAVLAVLLVSFISCENKKSEELNMDNYFAWCIVPFDNQNRTPEERVEMLKELGFESYAYDWRTEHLPEMAREINLARENGIDINAVWMWIDNNDSIGNLSGGNQKVLDVLEETGLETQIWMSFPENYFEEMTEEERLAKATNMISYICDEAEKRNCTVGLYNHGGWFGNPDNLVKIVDALPEKEVGIIFNFHHAHEMLVEYTELVENMMPHLWAVNLNGMNPEGPKILPIGEGSEEAKMIQILEEKGYDGPYGILGHRTDADVKLVLQGNIEGLKRLKVQ